MDTLVGVTTRGIRKWFHDVMNSGNDFVAQIISANDFMIW